MLPKRTRETKIRRDALGRWFDDDVPIVHQNLVRAFDGWIGVAEDGRYCLENDINWAYVEIEGAPLFVRSVWVEKGVVWLVLSNRWRERLRPATLRQDGDGVLYCDTRGGTMTAKFDRAAMLSLSELLDEDDDGLYLSVGGNKVRPPVVDDPIEGA